MISHPHKTIFIHIPKCGGQSVEMCYLKDLGLSWKNRAPLLLLRNSNLEVGPPRLAHLTAEEYLKYYYSTEEMFDTYYSFSIMRNPVYRVVSIYNYLRPRRFGFRIGFDNFLFKWLPAQLGFHGRPGKHQGRYMKFSWFVRPQADYILNTHGDIMVKDVFMLEHISRSFSYIKERSKVRSDLPHLNRSKDTQKRDSLDSEQIEFIKDMYKKDFHLIDRIGGQISNPQ